jgi:hypothetical protein
MATRILWKELNEEEGLWQVTPAEKKPHRASSAALAHLDELLDEALEQTFSASDAYIPEGVKWLTQASAPRRPGSFALPLRCWHEDAGAEISPSILGRSIRLRTECIAARAGTQAVRAIRPQIITCAPMLASSSIALPIRSSALLRASISF